jgi:hypothetical protein
MMPVTTLSTWAVAAGGQALSSLFGNTFTLYSVAPIGWLLIGWISAEHLRKLAAVAPGQSQANYAVAVSTEREQFAI